MWTCHNCTAEMYDALDACRKCGTAKRGALHAHLQEVERFRAREKAAQLRGLDGIAGWLILPSTGMLLIGYSILFIVFSLWPLLLMRSYGFEGSAGTGLMLIAVIYLALLVFLIYTAVSFYKRRKRAPALIINLMIANIIAAFFLMKITGVGGFLMLALGVLIAAVCIPYLLKSERVKITFAQPITSQAASLPRVDHDLPLPELEQRAVAMHEAGLTDVMIKERLISSGVKSERASTVMKNLRLTDAILPRVYLETFYQEFDRFADLKGRSSCYQFWMFTLVNIVAGIVLAMTSTFLSNIFSLLITIPGYTIMVRRLHDTGRSGWWILLLLLSAIILGLALIAPITGTVTGPGFWWSFLVLAAIPALGLLRFLIQAGDVEANKYGPPPR